MVIIKRLETIQIEGTTEKEVRDSANSFLNIGYSAEIDIMTSDDPTDPYPYFTYVMKDEFAENL